MLLPSAVRVPLPADTPRQRHSEHGGGGGGEPSFARVARIYIIFTKIPCARIIIREG